MLHITTSYSCVSGVTWRNRLGTRQCKNDSTHAALFKCRGSPLPTSEIKNSLVKWLQFYFNISYWLALYLFISLLSDCQTSVSELTSPISKLCLYLKTSCFLGSISYTPVHSTSVFPPYAYSTPLISTPVSNMLTQH